MTWDAAGACRAVVACREKRKWRVLRQWEGAVAEGASVGQELRVGLEALGVADAEFLVAGCADIAAGCADIDYPILPEREMRSSLQYELAYHAPLQQERLVWGYRVLAVENSKQTLRIYYLRETDWHRWLDELGSLGRGIDAAIPPHVCLDPLLADLACFLPAADSGGFLLPPDKTGKRDIQQCAEPPEEAVGAGDSPLGDIADFDPGSLADLDADEQRSFLPSILLALYALSPTCHQDRKTRIAVPYDLRPVRNRYNKMAAITLAALLGVLAIYAVGREYAAAAGHHEALKDRIASVERAQSRLLVRSGSEADLNALAEELRDLPINRVSFGAALAELTQLTPMQFWTESLSWREGRLDVQFATEDHDSDILQLIEGSDLFSSVSPQGVRVDRDGIKHIKVRMYATIPGELNRLRETDNVGAQETP